MKDLHTIPAAARVEYAINYIAETIRTQGDEALGGIEQEVITLDPNGALMSHAPVYQTFLGKLINGYDPAATLSYVDSLENGQPLLVGASVEGGDFCPEVSTCTTEFATKPERKVRDIFNTASRLADSIQQACAITGSTALSVGLVPNIGFEDFREKRAAIPNPSFEYSYNNITKMERMEVSQTSFGNASVHNNQGFNDPERMYRFARVCLHIQPTMIAMTANSPIWSGGRANDDSGQPLLTRRSWLQTQYERTLGYSDLEYMYPSCLLDQKNTFKDYVRGVLNQRLDRTIVNGEKVRVGDLTMAEYLTNGYEGHLPDKKALMMMFNEPMVDVRFRPFGGPRVEARAHDAGEWELAPALHAFYRGIAANLDAAEDLIGNFKDGDSVRKQRMAVCYHGLATPMDMHDTKIRTQQDFAKRLMALARRGLALRNLGEEEFLEPISDVIETGISPAQKQIDFLNNLCDGTLNSQGKVDAFIEAFPFKRIPLQQQRRHLAPACSM